MEEAEANAGNGSKQAGVERRRKRRRKVLKHAQLIFGFAGSTIDCLVLDESSHGVQIETPVMTHFPEHLRICFASGETYQAVRLWATGNRLGLHFIGSQIYDEETLRQRKAIRLALKTQGVKAAVHMLDDVGFFKIEALREAATAAELAVERLSALLS